MMSKNRKLAAWILFIIFYADFGGSLYASVKHSRAMLNNIEYRIPYHNINSDISHLNKGFRMPGDKLYNRYEKNNYYNAAKQREDKEDNAGPSQPEMATFKSVNTDNMVNLFTGDFSYNIPLIDVGGYPINLFYTGGITMDQDASWVGLGWNINPGTITRNMRGIPDDFDGNDIITKTQNVKNNVTVGGNYGWGAEILGLPVSPSVGYNTGIFYNNYNGLGLEAGMDIGVKLNLSKKSTDEKNNSILGAIGLGVGLNLNSQDGFSVQPTVGMYLHKDHTKDYYGLQIGTNYNSRTGISSLQIDAEGAKYSKLIKTVSGSNWGIPITFAKPSYTPTIRMPITRTNATFDVKLGDEFYFLSSYQDIKAYMSTSVVDNTPQSKPAVGYLYLENGNNNKDALLDFNRINDVTVTENTPMISIPHYTYDVFNITGEGTGGSFRAYRGNIGFVRDPYTVSSSDNGSGGFELSSGNVVHVGVDLDFVNSPTSVYNWSSNNLAADQLQFNSASGLNESVYFKNPAEKAIVSSDYFNALGGDNLVRLKLLNPGTNKPFVVPTLETFNTTVANNYQQTLVSNVGITAANTIKIRDKRSQVITYLNAMEASRIGLDKKIRSFNVNDFSTVLTCLEGNDSMPRYVEPPDPDNNYRRQNHISEINVLEPDGKRYVYGIPVYSVSQKDVSFAVETPGTIPTNGLISYDPTQASTGNTSGKDHFYQSEVIPAYPHSFLLTALLSPDYVDVTGDGITDDDLGDAVKFNYSRIGRYTSGSAVKWDNYRWRTPFMGSVAAGSAPQASYTENLKTDGKDDRASYSYGVREMWYLHSLESKNMVAIFWLSGRQDNLEPADENGAPMVSGLQKLDSISLYSRAEFVNNGIAHARPIKTVNFTYSYDLCKGTPSNPSGSAGKLTLTGIYFTYNWNSTHRNTYVFNYGNTASTADNPAYSRNTSDRWGTYKDVTQNPTYNGSQILSNSDYPYTIQSTTANNDQNAGVWNLKKILLPSGGQIDVCYEADDYAYVQDRRASQMFNIAGFGNTTNQSATMDHFLNGIYDPLNPKSSDYDVVYINIPNVISTTNIGKLYFESLNQLAFKLWIKMKHDFLTPSASDDYEAVNVYGEIDSYGYLKPGYIWVKLKHTSDGSSPLIATAIQFFKDNLSSKAYPGSNVDPGANIGIQFIRSIVGMITSLGSAFTGIDTKARIFGYLCTSVDLSRAFVRLANPSFKKTGGGYRVKEIRIKDHWKWMTTNDDKNTASDPDIKSSVYGQHYSYTTTIKNPDGSNNDMVISSGVATYEPGIGAEENPFKEVLSFGNTLPLGPTENGFIDMPFAETFFPAPMVGYSKVQVTSINSNSNPAHPKKVKSGVGTQVTEYYTCKDFPFFADFTNLDPSTNVRYKPDPILNFLKIDVEGMQTLSQGFRVILNDMNGKIKSQASYPENDNINAINSTQYIYKTKTIGNEKYQLCNNVNVVDKTGYVTNKQIGRDIELMADFREHQTETTSDGAQFNDDGSLFGIFPVDIPIGFISYSHILSTYRSAAVLKVINEYGIIDQVIHTDKGSTVTTQNLAYDSETGEPVVTQSNNEFNNPVYSLNYPAYWAYTGMEPAYKNIDATYSNVEFQNGIITSGINTNDVNNIFESGDEIYVDDINTSGPANTQGCIDIGPADGGPNPLPQNTEGAGNHAYKIWALDITKDLTNTTKRIIFIDKDGTPYNSKSAYIRIVRSGKRNLLQESAGSITSLVNPIYPFPVSSTGATSRITIGSNTNVINAGATEYKEKWKAEDAFYQENIYKLANKYAPIHYNTHKYPSLARTEWGATHSCTFGCHPFPDCWWSCDKDNNRIINDNPFSARGWDNGGANSSDYNDKSFLQFNIADMNLSAQVIDAYLSLYAHTEQHNAYTYPTPAPYTNYPQNYTIPGYNSHSPSEPNKTSYDNNNNTPDNNFTITRINSLAQEWMDNNKLSYTNDYVYQTFSPWLNCFQDQSNTESFCYDPTSGIDNRILVTNMAQNMVYDYFQNNIPAGVGITLSDPESIKGGDEQRVCFGSGFAGGQPVNCPTPLLSNFAVNSPCTPPPALEIRYYNPSEIASESTQPPNGVYYIKEAKELLSSNCYSYFDRIQMNPYLHGSLGNWRVAKNYVFYSNRVQSDPSVATNISTDGAISNFAPYWNFQSTGNIIPGSSTNWVWNSQISQVNKKGFEIENYDALYRFNAGLYGYNSNLPTAVVNNAKYRESGFDGFEDYAYADRNCDGICQDQVDAAARHWNLNIDPDVNISTAESHTGTSSLKVSSASNFTFTNPVSADLITATNPPADPVVKVALNVTPSASTPQILKVTPNSKAGLTRADYSDNNFNNLVAINLNNDFSLPNPIQSGTSYQWNGILQVAEPGNYSFAASVDNDIDVTIATPGTNGNPSILMAHIVMNASQITGPGAYTIQTTAGVNATYPLNAGSYLITVKYRTGSPTSYFSFLWKTPDSDEFLPIPAANLYDNATNSTKNEVWVPNNCERPGQIQVTQNAKIDAFSIAQDKKMVLSTWVKQGGADCKCSTYVQNAIQISFTDATGTAIVNSSTTNPFQPAGNIIEGWQRYECVFDVPHTAASMTVQLQNTSTTSSPVDVYFDDLRIHPFNANMKSFVYHPVTLRLVAELDENNYATFYEYDTEGTLARVKKETKDGIKTIKETRSAIQTKVTTTD